MSHAMATLASRAKMQTWLLQSLSGDAQAAHVEQPDGIDSQGLRGNR